MQLVDEVISAADAAKHMMQVTSMVVDKAAAKVAEEEAKKESYAKEIKLVESEVVKKEAELKAARGVQVIQTPGAAAAEPAGRPGGLGIATTTAAAAACRSCPSGPVW